MAKRRLQAECNSESEIRKVWSSRRGCAEEAELTAAEDTEEEAQPRQSVLSVSTLSLTCPSEAAFAALKEELELVLNSLNSLSRSG